MELGIEHLAGFLQRNLCASGDTTARNRVHDRTLLAGLGLLKSWLGGLPQGCDPRQFAAKSVALSAVPGERDDLVLWKNLSLLHASSANRAARPHAVQYLSMYPTEYAHNAEWLL